MAEAGPSKRRRKSRVRDSSPSSSSDTSLGIEVLDEDVDVVDDFSSDEEPLDFSCGENKEDDDDDDDDDDDEDWQPSDVQTDSHGQGISLCTMLKGNPEICNIEEFALLVCREVLETLKFNELNGKVHGSVNPCNIWLYPTGQVRLYKPTRNIRQHRAYRAPEAIEYGSSHEAEIYSLGVLAIVLLGFSIVLYKPGYVEVTDAERAETRSLFQTLLPQIPPLVRNFLQLCLNDNPSERKTAAYLIETPWMQGVKRSYAQELGEWVRTFPVDKLSPWCTCDSKTPIRQAQIVRDAKGKPVQQWKKFRYCKETERKLYKEFVKKYKCSNKTYEQNAPRFDVYRRKWMRWIKDKNQQPRTTTRTMADFEKFNPEQIQQWLSYVRGKQIKRAIKNDLLYYVEEKVQDRLHDNFNVPRRSAASVGNSQQAKVDPLAHLNQRWKMQRSKIKQDDVEERKRKVERYDRKKNTEMSEKEKRGAKRKRKIEEEEEDERDNRKKRRDQ